MKDREENLVETVQLSQRGNSLQLMCQLLANLKSLSSYYRCPSFSITLVNKTVALCVIWFVLDLLLRSQKIFCFVSKEKNTCCRTLSNLHEHISDLCPKNIFVHDWRKDF